MLRQNNTPHNSTYVNRLHKWIKYIITIFTVWFLAHLTYIILDGLTDLNKKADLAVVLGNKVNEDGTLSERLKKRLECGLALYNNGRVKKILVSGGYGKEGFFEGTKMKDYLIKNKVSETDIILDNKGSNTIETVENTLKLRDSLKFKSIIVVSQYFHLSRTKMLFRKRHFNEVSSVSPNYFEFRDLYSLTREFFAYYNQ